MHNTRAFLLAAALLAAVAAPVGGQETSADEQSIRGQIDAYVEAYNRRDAEALADLWATGAVYVNPETGERAEGREAILAEFQQLFADEAPEKLSVSVKSLRIVSPTEAKEEGVATVQIPGQPPSRSKYTATHVKQGDQWLLQSVEEAAAADTTVSRLDDLAWLEGTWIDADEEAVIRSTYRWTANRAFLTQSFAVIVGDKVDAQGLQVIGWDPEKGHIRSWTYDADGGFGEGTWEQKDGAWIISQRCTLPDGRKGAAINVLKRIDDNTISWKSTAREVGGEMLPNVDEVTIVRQQTE